MALINTKLTSTTANVLYGTLTENKAITCIYFCNTTASTVAINLFAVPNGSTVANCVIYNNLSIAAADTAVVDMEKIILGEGDSIQANCTVNDAVAMTVSYVGI
jgi:hypothetical protein